MMTHSASDVPAVGLALICPNRLCVILTELNPAGLQIDIKFECVLEDNLQNVTLCSSEDRSCIRKHRKSAEQQAACGRLDSFSPHLPLHFRCKTHSYELQV